MDSDIQQLPSSVSKLLCSTQVITSPTSVIKELTENALDAGATNIDVKLESFGLDRIEVRDNGSGIKLHDAQYMALPHCTSKIYCESDLANLSTYGFRGEALSAICSIGEVTISTRSIAEEVGTTFRLDSYGNVISQNPCSLNQGTSVIVTKLFKNVPVRRQYYSTLIKKKDELKNVEDLLRAYAIVGHQVRFSLYHNKSLTWQKGRSADLKSSLQQALGLSLMNQLDALHYRNPDKQIQIVAFVPKLNSSIQTTGRLQPDMTYLFVNQRPVKQKTISQILKQYYSTSHGLLGSGMKYPVCCLCVQVPNDKVDVNIDPSKSQIFFHDKEVVLAAIESMLENVYGMKAPVGANLQTEISEKFQTNSISETRSDKDYHSVHGKNGAQVSYKDLSASLQSDQCKFTANQNSDFVLAAENSTSEMHLPVTDKTSISNICFDVESNCDSQESENKPKNINELKNDGTPVEYVDSGTTESMLVGSSSGDEQFINAHEASNLLEATQWSKGCIRDNLGEIIEPPQILIGATKRNLPINNNESYKETKDSPVKKKQKSLDVMLSNTLDDYFASTPNNTHQDTPAVSNQTKDNAQPGKRTVGVKSKKINITSKKLHSLCNKNAPDSEKLQKNLVEISKSFIQSTATSEPKTKTVEIQFNIEKIRQTLGSLGELMSSIGSQVQCSPMNTLTFIGKLDNGFWIVRRNENLEILHHHRISETLLYQRLMESHKISVHPLEMPIVLTESHLGKVEWETLLKLSLPNKGSDSVSSVMDDRIVGNGFTIKRYDDVETDTKTMHLMGAADHIPYYGISDLRECLSKIAVNSAATLLQCRPLKVTHYLKGEAIRMARGQVAHQSEDDLQTLLRKVETHLPQNQKCLHGLPFFTAIYSTEELPEILDDDV